jgi:hypothetical protein
MNTMLLSTKLNWALIILFMFSILTSPSIADNNQQCQWVAVDQNSFAKILTMINSRVEENYGRIKTWQGKVNIVTESVIESEGRKRSYERILVDKPLPNEIIDHVELTKEFAVDANEGLLYEGVYPDAQQYIIDAQTGENLQLNERVQIGSGKKILTPNYQLNCKENKNRDGIVVSRKVIKQSRPTGELTCQGHLSPVFDPRETMRIFGDIKGESFAPLGGAFAKYLSFLDKEVGNSSIDGYPTIAVEECDVGNVKKYRISLLGLAKDSNGATVHFFYNLVCSSEIGFNVVSYSTTDEKGRVLEHKTWEYDLFDGVYLPKVVIRRNFTRESGRLNYENKYTFKNQKVNKPIPSETFTYRNLDLENGDEFIDKMENKKYRYQDANLVPISEPNKSR